MFDLLHANKQMQHCRYEEHRAACAYIDAEDDIERQDYEELYRIAKVKTDAAVRRYNMLLSSSKAEAI